MSMSQFVLITGLFIHKNKLNTDSLTSKNYHLGEATDHEQNDIKIIKGSICYNSNY